MKTRHQASGTFDSGTWQILLVDDEPTQRLIMARLLKRAGYDVQTAANGREALEMLERQDFHIMITDWEMPEMDGIALCDALRRRKMSGYVYAIILCARDSIESVVTGLAAGADDYLTKPVIERELIARLNTGKRIISLQRSLSAAIKMNRRLALRHPLTDAKNRLYLMQRLPKELQRASRRNAPMALVMCDIDNFKHVNDTYGHAAGGDVRIAVARFLELMAQEVGGWLCHHGGDEFTIVLPNMRLSAAGGFAESVRAQLCEQCIPVGKVRISITASFGVSGWDDQVSADATTDDLLRTTDECVYQSKFAGRNRVSLRSVMGRHSC